MGPPSYMWSVVDRNVVMSAYPYLPLLLLGRGPRIHSRQGDRLFRMGLLLFASFPLDFEIVVLSETMLCHYSFQYVIHLSPFHLTLRNLIRVCW